MEDVGDVARQLVETGCFAGNTQFVLNNTFAPKRQEKKRVLSAADVINLK